MATFFVEVGHPCQRAPQAFVRATVHAAEGNERQEAKLFRRELAEKPENFGLDELCRQFGIRFAPADFYWAIFQNLRDEKPILASDNWYWRQDKSPRAPRI